MRNTVARIRIYTQSGISNTPQWRVSVIKRGQINRVHCLYKIAQFSYLIRPRVWNLEALRDGRIEVLLQIPVQ